MSSNYSNENSNSEGTSDRDPFYLERYRPYFITQEQPLQQSHQQQQPSQQQQTQDAMQGEHDNPGLPEAASTDAMGIFATNPSGETIANLAQTTSNADKESPANESGEASATPARATSNDEKGSPANNEHDETNGAPAAATSNNDNNHGHGAAHPTTHQAAHSVHSSDDFAVYSDESGSDEHAPGAGNERGGDHAHRRGATEGGHMNASYRRHVLQGPLSVPQANHASTSVLDRLPPDPTLAMVLHRVGNWVMSIPDFVDADMESLDAWFAASSGEPEFSEDLGEEGARMAVSMPEMLHDDDATLVARAATI
ncbi:hypothetical protein SUNI508_05685 [Seiridium unicorne]|uniref:Uncharacterized protein n=1 Tax=Seiridium unicorne TaxID=138068 RepID=A0ABR2V3F5_9PEZI